MVLGILGLAAMILCWAAGSYWKKVYYLIWFLSLPMPIFWFLYSFSMDEDGDGGSSGGIEAVLTVIILIILVIIYVKARNLGDAINTFLLMNVNILLMILLSDSGFRTISGNPRQFNYRDESVGLCVSAQKYNNKNLFLISPDSCICFRKKAGQICVEKQEHFVL